MRCGVLSPRLVSLSVFAGGQPGLQLEGAGEGGKGIEPGVRRDFGDAPVRGHQQLLRVKDAKAGQIGDKAAAVLLGERVAEIGWGEIKLPGNVAQRNRLAEAGGDIVGCADEYIAVTLEAGTETFYRLGQRIEHEIRKHNTLPPPDFHKWAAICEHIIRHYNEGWANGYRYNIRYWEIWNEADLDPDDCPQKRTWGGTAEQYFELYEITAKHLKACFPQLRIGGPALAHSVNDWAERFLSHVERTRTPLDFFSWHIYCTTPEKMMEKNARVQALLERHGLGGAENILDEWNYIRGWDADFVYSLRQISGLKGASFTLACMCEAQKSSIDMLMYYDARPCGFNGLFAPYTLEPLKGYYPFLWYGMLYGRQEVRAAHQPEHLYSLCGVDGEGKTLTLLTHYDEDDNAAPQTVRVDFGRRATCAVYILGRDRDGTLLCETDDLTFTIPVHTSLLIREL